MRLKLSFSCISNLEATAKHEWVLVYATDEATTAIPTSVLADINQILEDNHGCVTKEERDAAMRRPEDFQDGEVWLMLKLGHTNPARLLVKRRLQTLDAETLEAEHTHICGGSDMDHMTQAQRLQFVCMLFISRYDFKGGPVLPKY